MNITVSQLATLSIIAATLNQHEQMGVTYQAHFVINPNGSGRVAVTWANELGQSGDFYVEGCEFMDESMIDSALLNVQAYVNIVSEKWAEFRDFAARTISDFKDE